MINVSDCALKVVDVIMLTQSVALCPGLSSGGMDLGHDAQPVLGDDFDRFSEGKRFIFAPDFALVFTITIINICTNVCTYICMYVYVRMYVNVIYVCVYLYAYAVQDDSFKDSLLLF